MKKNEEYKGESKYDQRKKVKNERSYDEPGLPEDVRVMHNGENNPHDG